MTPGQFYEIVLSVCMSERCSMISGYRTSERNDEVGGSRASRHMDGMAFDVAADSDYDSHATSEVDDIVRRFVVMGCQVLRYDSHLHVQWPRPGQQAGEIT